MRIKNLDLVDFRSYHSLSLPFSAGINLIFGENAQGKTNILEAVYYSALARSHRTNNEREMINKAAESASLKIDYEKREVEQNLSFFIYRTKKRKILLEDRPIQLKKLIGSLNVVCFSPEDLYLVKGAPANRRLFLDRELSQASANYYQDIVDYAKIVEQRNSLLKRIRDNEVKDDGTMEVWDEAFSDKAARLLLRRLAAVEKFGSLAKKIAGFLTGGKEEFSLSYEIHEAPSDIEYPAAKWENFKLNYEFYRKFYKNESEKRRKIDIARGFTTFGPHRDDLKTTVNEEDLRSYGSQGQQRTAALALKLSELEFLRENAGEYPILLLDDVMSELDKNRRLELLEFIRQNKIQSLITATDRAYFSGAMDIIETIYEVKKSEVKTVRK